MSILTTAQIANLKKEATQASNRLDLLEGKFKPMKSMFIYYGRMTDLVDEEDVDIARELAAQIIAKYDMFITGVSDFTPGSIDHDELTYIFPRVREINPTIETLGYIELGHHSEEHPGLTMEEITEKVDLYIEHCSVTGIFLDEFGYDYYDATHYQNRERNNIIIDYIHGKNLNCMVNGSNYNQLFGLQQEYNAEKDHYGNYDQIESSLSSQDYHMRESMFCTSEEWYGETGLRFSSPLSIRYSLGYFMDAREEAFFEGKTYYEHYGTKMCGLNYLSETYTRREALLRDTIYMSILFNVAVYGIGYLDSFYHFSIPDDAAFEGFGYHSIVPGSGVNPTEYSATVGKVNLACKWDPDNNDFWVTYNDAQVLIPVGSNIHNMKLRIADYNIARVVENEYTVVGEDMLVLVDYTLSGACSILLPSTGLTYGREVIIKDSGGNSSVNNITISSINPATLIDGAATRVIDLDFGSAVLYYDGEHWHGLTGAAGTSEMQDYVASTVKTWILGETYELNNVEYNSDGTVIYADVLWPDESEGTISGVVSDIFGISLITYTRGGSSFTLQVLRSNDGNVISVNFI